MKYKTNDFESPTGGIMIYAIYNEENGQLAFEIAKGYLYPQDSKNMIRSINTDQFITNHSTTVKTIEEANQYLESLNINKIFHIKN